MASLSYFYNMDEARLREMGVYMLKRTADDASSRLRGKSPA